MASESTETKKAVDPDFDLILDENLAVNQWPKDKFATIKSAERVSLMAQAMSEDLFNKLKDVKSPKVYLAHVSFCHRRSFPVLSN